MSKRNLSFFYLKKRNRYGFSNYQRLISGALIFFILFNLAFRFPFSSIFNLKANAENKDFYNLVAVIVDNNIYSDVNSKIKRYAKDVESVLNDTKVVIIPTPKNASSFKIASLLESLYFD